MCVSVYVSHVCFEKGEKEGNAGEIYGNGG